MVNRDEEASKARNTPSNRLGWVDLIRVVSAFLVVVIHIGWQGDQTSSTYYTLLRGALPDTHWLFANFVDTFMWCAIPLFFMVSGYLILNKPNSLKHGYFKRLLKIGIPLFAWSIIYLIIRYWLYGVDHMGNPPSIYNGIRCILTNNVAAHFWFLYVLLSLYIAAPILRSYLKSASRENKIYFILLLGCACFLWPIISDVLKMLFDINKVNFDFYIVSGFVGYFVAGYLLGQQAISPRICLLCLISFTLITIIITVVGLYFFESEIVRSELANYLRIPLVLMLFTVLKYVGDAEFYQRSRLSAGISYLAPLTFGIYLIHSLIVHAFVGGLFGFSLSINTFAPWYSIPLMATLVYALSALIVWLLKKIPLMHWILP